jgi:hypothetical protein
MAWVKALWLFAQSPIVLEPLSKIPDDADKMKKNVIREEFSPCKDKNRVKPFAVRRVIMRL